ncbi:MAG: hypothetical protein IJD51_01140 [Clostridia bacterium]|nr:hypothetical protein [Clostridia bacterium]
MIKIKIANIPIGLEPRFDYTRNYVKDYLTDEEPEFVVSASDEDIAREYELSGIRVPDFYAENVVLYRRIAEKMPEYDALVFHGAVLEYEGVAYAVTAHSGVGKTTHTRLWLSEFDARILNGDKPILRLIDGKVYACATPWMGKEGYGYNAIRPLGGVGFLARGEVNIARKITPKSAVMRFMNQVYLPRENAAVLVRSMRVCDRLISGVPLYEFECNMDPEAAHVTYAAFVNGITNG